MELEAAGIPYLLLGEHFGSLYPGMQVAWYNERTVQVRAAHAPQAQAVVDGVRATYEPASVNLDAMSKLRIILEAVLFGWVMPAGTKRASGEPVLPEGDQAVRPPTRAVSGAARRHGGRAR